VIASRAHRLSTGLRDQTVWIALGGMVSSLLVGAALVVQPGIGLALLLAPAYAALVLVNLSLGLAFWVPLTFLAGSSALNAAGKAAGILVAAAWFGSLQSLPRAATAALHRHRVLLMTLAATIAWVTFSLAWSEDPGRGLADLWHWYVVALLFVVVVTTVTTTRTLKLIVAAFVAGAAISVAIGAFDGSLVSSLHGETRFGGGDTSDPNVLAAAILPATVLAVALLTDTRSPALRGLLVGAIVLLITGWVATESRGGAAAAVVAIIAAFVLFKERRRQVAAVAALALGVAALTFVSSPGTWERVTSYKNDNGRADLRTVAWRMGMDEPVTGVGLNNFEVRSPDYVREPGALTYVGLIVDDPHLVHNTYLQLFAENGIVGLALFLGVVVGCLRAAKLGADRFRARGERSLETLARAVMVATIGVLAADLSLSAATEQRLWLLLALGPALLTVASRGRAEVRLARERPTSRTTGVTQGARA
jgi:O-antigen ligase